MQVLTVKMSTSHLANARSCTDEGVQQAFRRGSTQFTIHCLSVRGKLPRALDDLPSCNLQAASHSYAALFGKHAVDVFGNYPMLG